MNYLIIATVCFSLSFGLIKNQLAGLPSDMVVELRLLLAALFFLPFFKKSAGNSELSKFPPPLRGRVRVGGLQRDKKDVFKVPHNQSNVVGLENPTYIPHQRLALTAIRYKKHLVAAFIGVIQFGLMYVFFLRAFKYLQGNEIVLLTTSTPILVAICSAFFGQRFKWIYLMCIILSVVGAIIVIWDNVSFNFLLKGILLMELSNLCFALGQVLWREYIGGSDITNTPHPNPPPRGGREQHDSQLMSSAYFAAAVFVLPLAIINTNFATFSLTTTQWLSILYLGVVPTGIGFWLWNKGATLVSSTTLAIMNNLKIPMGILFALVIFHERINLANFALGSIFILAGIILSKKVTTQAT